MFWEHVREPLRHSPQVSLSWEVRKAAVRMLTQCTGTCDSTSKVTFTPGKKPEFEGECNCCKLQPEEMEVKLKCTKTDGTDAEITKTMKFPTSCGCGECKKKGKKGGKKGKKGGKGGKGREGN